MSVLIGRVITQLLTSQRVSNARRWMAALLRLLLGRPARLEYCHQLDDPLQLVVAAAIAGVTQAVSRVADDSLVARLWRGSGAGASAGLVASRCSAVGRAQLGLSFNAEAVEPNIELLELANREA
jgi:hypothetical protein